MDLTYTEAVLGLLERGTLPSQPQPAGLPQHAPHGVGLHRQGVHYETLVEGGLQGRHPTSEVIQIIQVLR